MTLFDHLICGETFRHYEQGILYLGCLNDDMAIKLLCMISAYEANADIMIAEREGRTHTAAVHRLKQINMQQCTIPSEVIGIMLICLMISTKFGNQRYISPTMVAQHCTFYVRESLATIREEGLQTNFCMEPNVLDALVLTCWNFEKLGVHKEASAQTEEGLRNFVLRMEPKVLDALGWEVNFPTVSELSSIIINQCFLKHDELYEKAAGLILQAKMEGCCDSMHSCFSV